VRLPGSKSMSNRILLLAALAEGTTKVQNLLDSDDIRYMAWPATSRHTSPQPPLTAQLPTVVSS
jgi:hypothetical protein